MADEQSDLIQTEFTDESTAAPKKKLVKRARKTAPKKTDKPAAAKKAAKKAPVKKRAVKSKDEGEVAEKPAPAKKEAKARKAAPKKKALSKPEIAIETVSEEAPKQDRRTKASPDEKQAPKKAAKKATRKILAVPEEMKAVKEVPPPETEEKNERPERNGRPMGRVKGGPVEKAGNRNERGNKRQDRGENRKEPQSQGDGETVNPRGSKLTGDPFQTAGILETTPKGFGFLRESAANYEQSRSDVFVPPDMVQKFALRDGQVLNGKAQQGPRGPQLVELQDVNGYTPEDSLAFPHFDELKAIFPNKRIGLETVPERFTTRVLDILAPVGRGQRGLIVSPPRAGKTTLLLHIAEAVQELHSETMHLMVCLVDERPEEVTEFKRQLPDAEIFASSNDEPARNHTRLAELCIERAKRLVEAGEHVFLVMDSITRLARAYNNIMGGSKQGRGRGIQSGGIMAGALEQPRRLFAAARNTREAGSLTILGTALVQTNSKADEAIFQEFKGTGNMELVLDRRIAEQFVFPAVDLFKSGTRREELLLPEHTLQKINLIRRGLAGHRPIEGMERLLFFLKKFPNNAQMLLEIKG